MKLFTPMSSSKNFIVLALACWSMIYFELVFVSDMRSESRLSVSLCGHPVASSPFVEKTQDTPFLWSVPMRNLPVIGHFTLCLPPPTGDRDSTVNSHHGLKLRSHVCHT